MLLKNPEVFRFLKFKKAEETFLELVVEISDPKLIQFSLKYFDDLRRGMEFKLLDAENVVNSLETVIDRCLEESIHK